MNNFKNRYTDGKLRFFDHINESITMAYSQDLTYLCRISTYRNTMGRSCHRFKRLNFIL